MSNYYDILGVQKNASEDEIRNAYRKLARKNHPDKGGDKDTFQKIQEAYETLSNPEKKSNYDNPGFNGFNGNFNGNFNMNEFNHFHQSFFKQRTSQRKSKRPDHLYTCKISLREAYFGTIKKLKIGRTKVCKNCLIHCSNCNGAGISIHHMQIGPFSQVVQQTCNPCSGTGKIKTFSKECNSCSGTNKIQEEKLFEIIVEKGTESNKRVVFQEWGEQPSNENELPGDFIVTIVIDDHETFKRSGLNLIYTTELSLKESLIGKELKINHFDGELSIDTKGFGIINPNKEYIIYNRGLMNQKGESGNLHIRFKINFPERSFNQSEIDLLKNTFDTINF
jgi:DnaJ-class molecular chaperone